MKVTIIFRWHANIKNNKPTFTFIHLPYVHIYFHYLPRILRSNRNSAVNPWLNFMPPAYIGKTLFMSVIRETVGRLKRMPFSGPRSTHRLFRLVTQSHVTVIPKFWTLNDYRIQPLTKDTSMCVGFITADWTIASSCVYGKGRKCKRLTIFGIENDIRCFSLNIFLMWKVWVQYMNLVFPPLNFFNERTKVVHNAHHRVYV